MAVTTAPYVRRDTFAQIGGAVALDLVNTVSWRLSDERLLEHLGHYDDVRRWAHQLGLIDDDEAAALDALAGSHPAEAAAEAAHVVELREALFAACYEGGSADPIATAHAEAVGAGRLVRDADADGTGTGAGTGAGVGWRWAFPVDLALLRRRIALAAVELLQRDDLELLAICSDAECGWVFLDHSPRHNRRWCVSADCGNRNRVREFYARRQASAAGLPTA
ncbi:CGNR zinc finger domain-containing protein [Agromyces sp. NPDC058064]|uniref:CGNR zinc finger domain-containing protein n=1 Tax=Agromyces sp. NPDC058064 TaxID=3346322 RepID=UPI0036D7DC68